MSEAKARYGSEKSRRDERLAVRATREERALIADASAAAETTVSDFVLRATLAHAEEVLADRRVFRLPEDRWVAFVSLLDEPSIDRPRLRRLLTTPSILER